MALPFLAYKDLGYLTIVLIGQSSPLSYKFSANNFRSSGCPRRVICRFHTKDGNASETSFPSVKSFPSSPTVKYGRDEYLTENSFKLTVVLLVGLDDKAAD